MITRLTTLAAALPAFILTVSSLRAADTWLTDFEKAKAAAAKDGKDLLMDFTGSDWCGWCIRLHEEVFSKDAFKQEAPKHFVLLELDFPQMKDQPEELKKQNNGLQEKYGIEGFPSIVLADAQGRPYAITGYEAGGAAKYLDHLAELRKVREKRDAGFKKAAAAAGVEKSKLIVEALSELEPHLVHTFYTKEIDEAIAADKEDVTGAKKSRDEFASEGEFRKKVAGLEEELAELHDEKKFEDFRARVDKFIEDEKLTGRRKQEMLMAKLATCEDDLPAAQIVLDEVIAVDAKSEMAKQAKALKETVTKMQDEEAKNKKSGGGKEAEKSDKPAEKEEK
jgi:thioredoxin-related protein